ncbi:MAG: transketolase [Candidatus Binatia bacterium]|nr:transketolase [Candidatus Binatia bacterium]
MTDRNLEQLCINSIRTLAIDAVQKANSGHPGMPLGAAPMAYVLWQHHLRHNPRNPLWPDRDRFVLSAGHGSMLLYALLYLTGYDVSLEDIQSFRQWGSITPGHPEFRLTPGVEATTGPLGQGAANAVGMAIAERVLAHRFNRPGHCIVDHRTYALLSDGDMMEGVCAEAASLAGHLRLGKLIFLYDSNGVSLDGPTSLTFSREDVAARFRAYGWRVYEVADGNHDTAAIDAALTEAESDTSSPALVIVHTTLGYGSPHKAGTHHAHGSPLGEEEVRLTKQALGWDPNKTFYVPDAALAHFRTAVERGERAQREWDERFTAYAHEYPELAEEWHRTLRGELPLEWDRDIPMFPATEGLATRVASGKVLNAIAQRVHFLMGGDGDLSVSTNTALVGESSFDGQTGAGRNLHFGVREHAMGAIANGLCYHGGVRPYVATFLVFSDYMRPPIRLAAMSHLPVIYVWTHDSIGVGEDGPTHQPIEHLAALRAIPNLVVIRPCDANETAEAWRWAMRHREGPVALILSRQKLPVLDRTHLAPASELQRGAYILSEPQHEKPVAIVIATGSEVHPALEAQRLLAAAGTPVRVVSMPSWELFAQQEAAYRQHVLPEDITARVAVEAAVPFGWERWVGERGRVIGMHRFGASAPGEVNLQKFGFTAEHIARTVREILSA